MADASCRRELELEIPAEEVTKASEKVAKEFAKMARVPGFRPGKAPISLIKRRFALVIIAAIATISASNSSNSVEMCRRLSRPIARVKRALRTGQPPPRLRALQARRNINRSDYAPGGKNTSVRTSMLSRGGAPGVSGFSKEVWNDSRARPSLALSCTRMNSTSSVCMSEK